MIELKHVSKVYESGAGQVHALRDVTFTLPSSGLVFVLGKSGCGKSTLLNLLGGMDSPTQGGDRTQRHFHRHRAGARP